MYNLKLAFRNLWRNMLYSSINIIGLAVSLAAVAFIFFWVKDELSYDRFHKDAENIYLGIAHFKSDGGDMTAEVTSGLFGPVAQETFSEVEAYCRVRNSYEGFVRYRDKKVYDVGYVFADSTFFTLFNFPIVKGEKEGLLRSPYDIVISERFSEQLFGEEDPIGKVISIGGRKDMRVAAVMKNIPHNTGILGSVGFICTYSSNLSEYYSENIYTWQSCEYFTFLRIKQGADIKKIAEQTTQKQTELQDRRWFTLQPLVNMHLYTVEGEPSGIKTVRLFMLIGAAILVIACINYVNLVTARVTKRLREVGTRKIMGGKRRQVFGQLMLESFVLFFIAMLIAIVLMYMALPMYENISGKPLALSWLNINIWLIFGGALLSITVLAGAYPALIASSYSPLVMMRGASSKGTSRALFRKVLVVVQFVSSVVLITGTITLNAQMRYIRQKSLGFDREHVFLVTLYDMAKSYDAIVAELMQNTAILGVTYGSENVMRVSSGTIISDWEGKTSSGFISVAQERIDTSFVKVMGMSLVAGDGFSSNPRGEFILNETAIAAMGIEDPIGKRAHINWEGRIVGVVKDFHFSSLHHKISPLVMYCVPAQPYYRFYIRTTGEKAAQAIAAVEKIWKQYNPDYEFSYQFLDDSFERIYRSDQRNGTLFNIFTIIAMFTSSLGLFGLATYTAETKTKEIGIRKTLGASVGSVVSLLSKEFLVLVVISIVIALPISYYLLSLLLQSYAYRIAISWWIFVLAALVVLVLVILTVSGQALRAARANPVKAIKTE